MFVNLWHELIHPIIYIYIYIPAMAILESNCGCLLWLRCKWESCVSHTFQELTVQPSHGTDSPSNTATPNPAKTEVFTGAS